MARIRSDEKKGRCELTRTYLRKIFDTYVATGVLSVTELAVMVGVSRAQIYNWGKGSSVPTDESFQNLLLVIDNLAEKA